MTVYVLCVEPGQSRACDVNVTFAKLPIHLYPQVSRHI
jgi:hypothetical protein